MAADIAPGLLRSFFGFLRWRGHDSDLWQTLCREAQERREEGLTRLPPIRGYDVAPRAIQIAWANAERAGLGGADQGPGTRFLVGDGLDECAAGSLDLVLCNPPFHQGRTEGDHVAWEMFRQARRALRPGGRLLVVGNRHLGYHWKLQRLFDRCETVASDRRFVVLAAE